MEPTTLPTPAAEATAEHGEVFTRRWVVELILDLIGYTPDRDLGARAILEPACGSGAFLIPLVERLVDSALAHGRDINDTVGCVVAMDLLQGNVLQSREVVKQTLKRRGVNDSDAVALAGAWIQQRNFLLAPPAQESVDFVAGNPPYIRLESIPQEWALAYRNACATMGGRADVYVGFYEHGLLAMKDGGKLGFICADRWMRNAYGARLRNLVSTAWSVEALLSMTGVDAFEEEVDAYPAVTLIGRGTQKAGPLVVQASPDFGADDAREIVSFVRGDEIAPPTHERYQAAKLSGWFSGSGGWPTGSPERLSLIADLEDRLPSLEDADTGTKVGIGLATGADKIYVVSDPDLVEPERLLPLALPRDIASGELSWSGKYLINPWSDEGLVNLDEWPRFAAYLSSFRKDLAKRHTARNGNWHRTIDRVVYGLKDRPKLYLPDFKDATFPVLDEGGTYPHHNLYWITSDKWDLRVLGGLLLSDVANLFIEAYSVRMRGGFLRFQAQYLRRIRLPHRESISGSDAAELAAAFAARDRAAATAVALPLYGLSELPA